MKVGRAIKIFVVISIVLLLSSGFLVDAHGKDIQVNHRHKEIFGSFRGRTFNNGYVIIKINKKGMAKIIDEKNRKILVDKYYPSIELQEKGKWVSLSFRTKIKFKNTGSWHVVAVHLKHYGKIKVNGWLLYEQKDKFKRGEGLYTKLILKFSRSVKYRVSWNYNGVKINNFEIIDSGSGYTQAPYREGHGRRIIYNGTIKNNMKFEDGQDILLGWMGKSKEFGLNWVDFKDKYRILGFEVWKYNITKEVNFKIYTSDNAQSTKLGAVSTTVYSGPVIDHGSGGGKDSDGDGLPDYLEKEGWNITWYDANGHKHTEHVTSDPNSTDTDGDGLSDMEEFLDSYTNPRSADTDGDGLSDYQEYKKIGTSPIKADTDGDGVGDGSEYYTRVYEYPQRVYVSGGKTIYLKWKEDKYTFSLKDAKVLVGIRGNGGSIKVNIYTDNKNILSKSTSGYYFASASLKSYASKNWKNLKVVLNGKGWLESLKIILVEGSNPKKWDTDGDGLSDGYELLGKSGYITSPVSKDTDGDGINDYWEIKGWSWNYDEKIKYRDNNGFHTNPCLADTDGDGYNDGVDADPLHNLVIKMTLDKYTWDEHPDYTKFVGFYVNWTLNGVSDSVKYYTEHKDHTSNLHGYTYWFDVPDDVFTEVKIKTAAFYNDHGDKELVDGENDFYVEKGLILHINKDSSTHNFDTTFQIVSLGRIHTVAVYNGSAWHNGRYLYSGKYYILYVESSNSEGVIHKGLNAIVVPEAIFVNSQLYRKINSNDISYLVGSDASKAKMGAITTQSMPVHIAGMFFFKSGAYNALQILKLLQKNLTSAVFAHYAVISPEQANLPADILSAIPLQSIQNSATGTPPEDLWHQIVSTFTNLVISAAQFIYNGLVAVGNFLAQAADVVAQFAMKLWSTTVSAVKQAVEVVKKSVDAVVNWIKDTMNGLFSGLKKGIDKLKESLGDAYKGFILAVYNKDTQRELVEFGKIAAFMGAIAGLIFGVYWGLAIAINANPIAGVIITGVVSAVFMAVFYSLYPKEYREAGESVISAGDLLLKPADDLYSFDKQYAGALGWFFTAITTTIGTAWSGAVTNSAVAAFITWSFAIATLFASLPLMDQNYHDTTVKKTIAVGLLGMATYGLVSTLKGGWAYVMSTPGIGSKIVRGVFYLLFSIIGAYSVLTLIGYLHKG